MTIRNSLYHIAIACSLICAALNATAWLGWPYWRKSVTAGLIIIGPALLLLVPAAIDMRNFLRHRTIPEYRDWLKRGKPIALLRALTVATWWAGINCLAILAVRLDASSFAVLGSTGHGLFIYAYLMVCYYDKMPYTAEYNRPHD